MLVEGLLTPSAAIGAAVVLMLASVAQAMVLPPQAHVVAWAGRMRDARSGSVRLGMIDVAAVVHYPDVLRRFRAERRLLEEAAARNEFRGHVFCPLSPVTAPCLAADRRTGPGPAAGRPAGPRGGPAQLRPARR